MSVDLRGFEYALEPLLRRWQWQLDALLARLGRVQQTIAEAQASLAALQDRYRATSQEAAQALVQRMNPEQHVRCLHWLAQLKTEILEGVARLKELEDERTLVRAQCLAQQQKLDVIEHHREESIADFTRLESGRLASEADRDWLARAAFQKRLGRQNRAAGGPLS